MSFVANALNISQAGLVAFDGVSNFSGRTLQAGAGISITNGNGVSGNPIISSSAAATDLHVAKLIVNSTSNAGGNYSTIGAAIAAASSGDTIFVMPGNTGTYTENFTIPAGIHLTGFVGDELTPNVTIIGKITFTAAGTSTITGLRLQTNSDNFLVVSGNSASILWVRNCYLNCANNTGVSYTSSSGSSTIRLHDCRGEFGTSGITLFTMSSSGTLSLVRTSITTGVTTTASTCSAGILNVSYCSLGMPITYSGSGGGTWIFTQAIVTNTTCVTFGGSAGSVVNFCLFTSGSASAISMSVAATLDYVDVSSSNVSAIAGAGALTAGVITFSGSSSTIAPTITPLVTNIGSLSLTTALSVANGGTGRQTLTNHGVLVGAATSAITQLAAGSAGQVLQSGGASADPAYSTATFPSTATGTGTILRADGTNWVATTSTYPNTNAVNTLLYASSANVMAALATANTGVLATSGAGVPSITSFPQISGLGIGASPGSTAGITFDGSNFLNNYATGTWTPTLDGAASGSTSYSVQFGTYVRIGNLVTVYFNIHVNSCTGTGNAQIGNIPFTINNTTNYNPKGVIEIASSTWAWPASTTMIILNGLANGTIFTIHAIGSSTNVAFVQMNNSAINLFGTMTYQI